MTQPQLINKDILLNFNYIICSVKFLNQEYVINCLVTCIRNLSHL
jgi:hypothetical protein